MHRIFHSHSGIFHQSLISATKTEYILLGYLFCTNNICIASFSLNLHIFHTSPLHHQPLIGKGYKKMLVLPFKYVSM